jgi:hypothetical protein
MAVWWLADWRDRSEAEAWMLVNLVRSLRAHGRDAEAGEAGRTALARPYDTTFSEHARWLALDAALEGDIAGARKLLDTERPPVGDSHALVLDSLVRVVVDARLRSGLSSKEAIEASRAALRDAKAIWPEFDRKRELWRAYTRVTEFLLRRRGKPSA